MTRSFVPGALQVSALRATGIGELLCAVEDVLRKTLVPMDLIIPYAQGALRSKIFSQGSVQWFQEGEDGTRLQAFVPPALASILEPYSAQ
jgi:GTP-binding protein HflX